MSGGGLSDPRTELIQFPGLGIKRANALLEMGVKSVRDLRKKEIFDTLPFETQLNLKYPVNRKLPWEFVDKIAKMLPEGVMVLGSYRRRRPILGDIDMLTTRQLPEVMSEIKKRLNVVGEFVTGDRRHAFIAKLGRTYFQVDLFNCSEDELPAAMLHWTGSVYSNIKLRSAALRRGMLLNQYGLYKDGKRIPVKSEQDIYKELGLEYKDPTHREK